jgi:hypothetical protein
MIQPRKSYEERVLLLLGDPLKKEYKKKKRRLRTLQISSINNSRRKLRLRLHMEPEDELICDQVPR